MAVERARARLLEHGPATPASSPPYARNVAALGAVEVVWGFGMALAPLSTVVPFLLTALGASQVVIGGLATAQILCIALPQLVTVYRSEHLPRKLTYFTVWHYPGCLAILAMGLFTYWASALGNEVTIGLILACGACFGISMGLISPLWIALMRKLLPPRTRNTYWSWIMAAGTSAGFLGAWLCRHLLTGRDDLSGYAACLVWAGLATFLGTQIFWFVREEPNGELETHETFVHFLRTHVSRAWASLPFRRLMLARIVAAGAGATACAFLAVAAKERFGLPDEAAAVFTVWVVGAQVVLSLLVGPLCDRFGSKVMCVLSPGLVLAAALAALYAPSAGWYGIALAITGGLWIADLIAVNGLVMDYCPHEDKSPFVAVASTLIAVVVAVAPLAGGALARAAGYDVLFGVIAGVCALAMVLAVILIEDPKRHSGAVQEA